MKSALLAAVPDLLYGFGTRAHPVPVALQTAHAHRHQGKQVHGCTIQYLSAPRQLVGDCDGVWTDQPGVPLFTYTADCLPILFVKKDASQAAALHAGWRGIFGGIATQWCDFLLKNGQNLDHWIAVIGPHIRQCCFQVQGDFLSTFQSTFPHKDLQRYLDHRSHFSLTQLQIDALNEKGLHTIETFPICTCCSVDRQGHYQFHSFRREKKSISLHHGVVLPSRSI